MTSDRYDLLVVGGGSGGIAMARRAALHGARTVLVESHRLGGTCVNVGCIPKKIMWHAAQLAHAIDDAQHYGFRVELDGLDWGVLRQRRDAYIERLNGIYARNLDASGVERVHGHATFVAPRIVRVGERLIEAEHAVIATGGQPGIPDIPGAQWGITSDGFFDLHSRPEHVALVDSGYVAVELAGVLEALGSRVTLVTRADGVLRDFDPLLREYLMRRMRDAGIGIVEHTTPAALSRSDGRLVLEAAAGHRVGEFDCVVWAIGRSPRTTGLGLEATGLVPGESGEILTDAFQNTGVTGMYAIGDVTGRIALTPVAIAAGRRLADRLFGGQPDRKLDYELVPTVVFSHPPVGTVGLTEPEARHQFGDAVEVFTADFVALYHAPLPRRPRSAMKLVTVGPERRIVGCHLIGEGVDEMLQGFAVAIRMGATKRDFDDTVAIHPTGAEELVTMK